MWWSRQRGSSSWRLLHLAQILPDLSILGDSNIQVPFTQYQTEDINYIQKFDYTNMIQSIGNMLGRLRVDGIGKGERRYKYTCAYALGITSLNELGSPCNDANKGTLAFVVLEASLSQCSITSVVLVLIGKTLSNRSDSTSLGTMSKLLLFIGLDLSSHPLRYLITMT